MAESLKTLKGNDTVTGERGDESVSAISDNLECAVCLQNCIHPAQLPCGHIFCFLCVKGIANQSKRCAICRQEIPRDFIEKPVLLQPNVESLNSDLFDGEYQWFYEGRNGWWQYDERTSRELESSYKQGHSTCELLIAGFLYVIDYHNMLQLRRNDPSRRRQIKRDVATIVKKGVAGLRTNNNSNSFEDSDRPVDGETDNAEPITPSNTPQTPISGRESPHNDDDEDSVETTIGRVNSLYIDGDFSF